MAFASDSKLSPHSIKIVSLSLYNSVLKQRFTYSCHSFSCTSFFANSTLSIKSIAFASLSVYSDFPFIYRFFIKRLILILCSMLCVVCSFSSKIGLRSFFLSPLYCAASYNFCNSLKSNFKICNNVNLFLFSATYTSSISFTFAENICFKSFVFISFFFNICTNSIIEK